MTSGYRPDGSREELRDVVGEWTMSMRVAGRAPNCSVAFGDHIPDGGPPARGWMLNERRPGAVADRYVILDDGDVWWSRTGASPALDAAVAQWLEEPTDDLVGLLARALANARLGGTGLLEIAGRVERVGDRRQVAREHEGPERRGA